MVKRYSPMEDPYVSAAGVVGVPAGEGKREGGSRPQRNPAVLGLSTVPEQALLPRLGSLPLVAGGTKGAAVLWGGWLWHQGKREPRWFQAVLLGCDGEGWGMVLG